MDLLTEFRRELLKAVTQLNPEDFYTKSEVDNLIRESYGRAKQRCANDEVSLEDE
jgi:hypothetical protein